MGEAEKSITELKEQQIMSTFDAETFMGGQTKDAGETHYTPCPSAEYQALIDDTKPKTFTNKETQEEGIILDVRFEILDDEVREQLGQDKVMVTQGYFCDVNAEGLLDWGTNKNVELGQLREAVGQNVDGEPWAPGMLTGAGPLSIFVTIEEDKQGVPRNRVKTTSAAVT